MSWTADISTLSTLQGTKLTLRLDIASTSPYEAEDGPVQHTASELLQHGRERHPHWLPSESQKGFPKALMQQQRLLGTGQDGTREWITLTATFCADGSSLPPALIYKAVSRDLQASWLQNYDPQEHPCRFESSPNGWTSDDLGLSWL
jgi:hypothetical protein